MALCSIRWLTQGDALLPSVRFRVLPFVAQARSRGFSAEAAPYPKTVVQRLSWFAKAALEAEAYRADILVLQKRLVSPCELRLLRCFGKYLVYDFDDAVWTDQKASASLSAGRHTQRFQAVCRGVDLVTAGNHYLADAVPQGTPVQVLPTPIDTTLYTPDYSQTAALPCVGWMGTASYLSGIQDAVERIAHASGQPVFVVSNAAPLWGNSTTVRYVPWSGERELALLRSFSIGLMPLEDTPYTRGKGGFKLLQYMACGVVPVASAVGFNCEIIQHGENGFLVKTPEEWSGYVSRLLQDAPLRQRMAEAARQTVCERFDCARTAEQLFALLTSLTQGQTGCA